MAVQSEKLSNYHTSLGFLSKMNSTLTLVVSISLILNLLLSLSLVMSIKKKQIVVSIDNQGLPVPMQITNQNLQNLINWRQFLETFVQKMYSWNSSTYVEQIRSALPLMANDMREEYFTQIEKNDVIQTITDGKITSVIQIKNLESTSVTKYKEGYMAEVEGIKLRVVDFVTRETPVKLQIAFRPVSLSGDNIWGFEVFEFHEENLQELVPQDMTGDKE